jgi:hypothetical protein
MLLSAGRIMRGCHRCAEMWEIDSMNNKMIINLDEKRYVVTCGGFDAKTLPPAAPHSTLKACKMLHFISVSSLPSQTVKNEGDTQSLIRIGDLFMSMSRWINLYERDFVPLTEEGNSI